MQISERPVRLIRHERKGFLEVAVQEHLVARSDNRGAIEHVAIAVWRPAVTDIVGAGENSDSAPA